MSYADAGIDRWVVASAAGIGARSGTSDAGREARHEGQGKDSCLYVLTVDRDAV